MTLDQLLAMLDARDVRLRAVDGRLSCDAPRGSLTPALRESLATHRDKILKRLLDTAGGIARLGRDDRGLPLSHAQYRLWLLDRLEGGTPRYNLVSATRVTGSIDVTAVGRALRALVARHEILRSRIVMVGDDVRQVPLVDCPIDVAIDDRSGMSLKEEEAVVATVCEEEAGVVFDLAAPPLLRVRLLRFSADRHVLVVNLHHILGDAYSLDVLARDLLRLYLGLPLPPLPFQYGDYAAWQRKQVDAETLNSGLAFWTRQLDDLPELLSLPTDVARPATLTYRGGSVGIQMSRRLVDSLGRLGSETGASLFMVLHTALCVVLSQMSGCGDIAVGIPVANRPRPELDALIGLFINSIVLRSRIEPRTTFRSLLAANRATALAAFAHQDTPFEKLVEALKVHRDLSYSPVFQVMLSFINRTPRVEGAPVPVATERLAIPPRHALFELDWQLRETEDGVAGFLIYAADLFAKPTAERLARQFVQVLELAQENPDTAIEDFDLLTPGERREILEEWNATGADYPRERLVHELFHDQVVRTPDAPAVTFAGESWTYRRLDEQADLIAGALRRRGVGAGALIGVCAERRAMTLAALLGILKAGAAYVPLDPGFPIERLVYMVTDARVALTLTDREIPESLRARLAQAAPIVVLDDLDRPPDVDQTAADAPFAPTLPESETRRNAPPQAAESLMYTIYTSGSTGQPKGVMLPHRAIVNFLTSMSREPGLRAADSLLAVTTLSFDIAALELFVPLIVGARVVLADRADAADPYRLMRLLKNESITIMQATPATWRMLLAAGWSGSPALTVLCGGEALPRELARQLSSRSRVVWNMYGPTETAVWSAIRRIESEAADPGAGVEPIGRPIANTRLYVVTPDLRPVPAGAIGELCIGGDGVAHGYLNQPALTAERFVADPFSQITGARLYRTGDRARFQSDGTVEFLGRLDHQVKLRGFRIELGEIESVLASHPAVAQCSAIIREDSPGDQRLVAYYVPARANAEATPAMLREHLRGGLPEYMIPAAFVRLDGLPLTPNGKIDRKRLPRPDVSSGDEGGAPQDQPGELETTIGGMWSAVLGVQRPGLDANFFDLGGHSLLIIHLHQRMVAQLGVAFDVLDLFRHPTIRRQASLVAGRRPALDVKAGAEGQAKRQHAAFRRQRAMAIERVKAAHDRLS